MSADGVVDGTRVTTVTFQERRRPTMIRTLEGEDVDVRGTFWIEPATGRVLKSELRTGEGNRRRIRAVITVTYAPNERLLMLVPVSMDETYAFKSIHITGHCHVFELPAIRDRGADHSVTGHPTPGTQHYALSTPSTEQS